MWVFCFVGDGNCSNTRGLEIAVKQRVDDALTSELPMFYLVNRPHISLVTATHPVEVDVENRCLSVNWSQGDTSLEVVDGLSGKITERLEFLHHNKNSDEPDQCVWVCVRIHLLKCKVSQTVLVFKPWYCSVNVRDSLLD